MNGSNCGAYYTPSSAIFNNGGVPLYYYDPMAYWGLLASSSNRPTWMNTTSRRYMWNNETGVPVSWDSGTDGINGPTAWQNASIPLVYEWDQPNGTALPTGPGQYPFHPLAGTGTFGDPGY